MPKKTSLRGADEIARQVGDRVENVRKQVGVKREDLHRLLGGISHGTYSKKVAGETSRFTIEEIVVLARRLGVSVDQLLPVEGVVRGVWVDERRLEDTSPLARWARFLANLQPASQEQIIRNISDETTVRTLASELGAFDAEKQRLEQVSVLRDVPVHQWGKIYELLKQSGLCPEPTDSMTPRQRSATRQTPGGATTPGRGRAARRR